jgi:hypothetical protein
MPLKAPSLKTFQKHSGIGGRREQANTETSAIEARSKSDKVLAATLHEEGGRVLQVQAQATSVRMTVVPEPIEMAEGVARIKSSLRPSA